MRQVNEEGALRELAALCAKGEHCQHELLEKMRRWQLDEDVQARIMEKLVNGHYVDDGRYARAFVRDKVRYNKWGRRKVEQALWLKHIDKAIIKETLDEVDDAEYLAVLRPLLKQKRKTTKARSDYELNQKLMRFAFSRGFTADIVGQCLQIEELET